MSKRTKKATKKIERLRNRLIHVDWVPDMKVGWLTRYMFVVDNFDIGDTKRANENRWLYTIGPHRRTRYPFETLTIPGTEYTLHWFTQCRTTDEEQEPEFRYVPIPMDSVTLPPDSAPYVPTVQISQTKGNWATIEQAPYFSDANCLIPLLSKNLHRNNFTIFDARKMAAAIDKLSLPLISEQETQAEMTFLETLSRMPEKLQPSCERKRKADEVEEERSPKKAKIEINIAAVTQRLLEILNSRQIVHTQEVSALLQVKESKVQQITTVLSVVGSVTISEDGFITLNNNKMPSYQEQPVQRYQENDSFSSMFGFSAPLSYPESLGLGDNFDNSASSVILPFSRPSLLSSFLTSSTNSNTTTSNSSSSSAEAEPHTSPLLKNESLEYSVSFPSEIGEREYSGWAEAIWSH